MDRFCEDCDALLIHESGDEMTSAERRFRCPDCGATYRQDPGGTLYEVH